MEKSLTCVLNGQIRFFRGGANRIGIRFSAISSFCIRRVTFSVVFSNCKMLNWTNLSGENFSYFIAHDSVSVRKAFVRFRRKCLWYCTIVMSINLQRVPITEESSESENEVEPARIFHRRLSTKNINNSVGFCNSFGYENVLVLSNGKTPNETDIQLRDTQ